MQASEGDMARVAGEFLQRTNLAAKEIPVFNAVMNWLQAKIEAEKANEEETADAS